MPPKKTTTKKVAALKKRVAKSKTVKKIRVKNVQNSESPAKPKAKTIKTKPVNSNVQSANTAVKVLDLLNKTKADASAEENSLSIDLLSFALKIVGKEGPIVLNLNDLMVDREDPLELVIGQEDIELTLPVIMKAFKKLSKLIAKGNRDHYVEIRKNKGTNNEYLMVWD